MRLFLDTADRSAWREWLPSGLFAGVTTNPTLLQRAGLKADESLLHEMAAEAAELGAGEFHVQSWGEDAATLEARALRLSRASPPTVIKLPTTRAGLQVAARLKQRGLGVTLTAIYEPHQLLLALAVGADYAAPYLGRMGESAEALEAVGRMQAMIDQAGARSKGVTDLLVASIRTVDQVAALGAMGAATLTLQPPLVAALVDRPQTLEATATFEAHARGDS